MAESENPRKRKRIEVEDDSVLKRSPGQLTVEEMCDVIRVFKKCKAESREATEVSTRSPRKRVAQYLGLGEAVVGRIVSHYAKTGELVPVDQGNKINHTSMIKDGSDDMIRLEQWYLQLYSRGNEPRREEVAAFLNQTNNLVLHKRTLQRVIRKIRLKHNLI